MVAALTRAQPVGDRAGPRRGRPGAVPVDPAPPVRRGDRVLAGARRRRPQPGRRCRLARDLRAAGLPGAAGGAVAAGGPAGIRRLPGPDRGAPARDLLIPADVGVIPRALV